MKYRISTAQSRKSTRWEVRKVSLQELAIMLKTPKRTQYTVKETKALSKDQRADLKDVGGFVGGAVTGGRRVRGSVRLRSLVTLDLDDAVTIPSLKYAHIIYSTHSHTPESKRLRIVAPLSREVDRIEYQAVSRHLASEIGIEQVDPCSYEMERLMYYPSCPSDAEFVYKSNIIAEPVNVDKILSSYLDFANTKEWAKGENETPIRYEDVHPSGMVNQKAPMEKTGIIGAFCRTYSIHDVIRLFLSDVYQKARERNRYTYVHGSSQAGLVVYDDGTFAYSNHSSDPIHGKTLNAFDFVRVVKFQHLDKNCKVGTPSEKLPSYKA
ncbi:hypothetical protein, partial [Porphyromonas cangingivalis]|uniref:hypothetical protein n=1 Tax=Porphyromonas cangingivalis TaxID=36874 RepID=UPI00242D96D2